MKKFRTIVGCLLKIFLLWRLGLLVIGYLGVKYAPSKIDYLGGGPDAYFKNPLFWCWANFDGVHYLNIAQFGYGHFREAFFPFYPILVHFFKVFFHSYLWSALFVAHLAAFIALIFFYFLVRIDFQEKLAKASLGWFLLFPTAFFLISAYSESTFLALVLGSFYFARKKKWLMAGILAGFGSATRLIGIFLFPALLVEWFLQNQATSKKDFRSLFYCFFAPLGLLAYMGFLDKTVADPLYFFHIQPLFQGGRSGGQFIPYYQVIWRYLKMISTTRVDVLYFTVWLEFGLSLLFLFLIIFGLKRIRFSYLVFSILAYFTPPLTGNFSSMPRYVLVLFPAFISLALLTRKRAWLRVAYPLFAIILGIISLIFFTRGYWLA